jgi:CBS-domain-containing membrane protein
MSMEIQQVMSAPVYVAAADTSVERAQGLLDRIQIHTLPVVDGGALMGIVCGCDLETAWPTEKLRHIAVRSVVRVSPHGRVEEAARAIASCQVGSVLVIDEGRLVGILTRGDLETAGYLPARQCASCGAVHGLVTALDEVSFCRVCLEQTRSDGVRKYYFTLGGGD